MLITPHILLREGDVIKIPGGDGGHLATVVGLVEGYLLCLLGWNLIALPRGFYLKKGQYYEPITIL